MGFIYIGLFVFAFTSFLQTLGEKKDHTKKGNIEKDFEVFIENHSRLISLLFLFTSACIVALDAWLNYSMGDLIHARISEDSRGVWSAVFSMFFLVIGTAVKNYSKGKFKPLIPCGAIFFVVLITQYSLIEKGAESLNEEGWVDYAECVRKLDKWPQDDKTLPIVESGLGNDRQSMFKIKPTSIDTTKIQDWKYCLHTTEADYNSLNVKYLESGYKNAKFKVSTDGNGTIRFFAIWVKHIKEHQKTPKKS